MEMQGLEDNEHPSEIDVQMLWQEHPGFRSEETTTKFSVHLMTSLNTRSSAITACPNAAIMFQKHGC